MTTGADDASFSSLVVVVEGDTATQLRVDTTPGRPFVEEILGGDRPSFVGSWQDACGVVLLAGEATQLARSEPKAKRLPPDDARRESDIYGKAVAVRTDERGDGVLDLTVEEYVALCDGEESGSIQE